MTSAVFLDRDGVINRKRPEGQYVTRWEEMELLPGVVEGIASLNQAGFRVIVVSNQRCVAKGLINIVDLEDIHRRMSETLARGGAKIDAIYYCPHEKGDGCDCRKPAPGMLLKAARSLGIELSSSWMIGDSNSDVEAGKKAGCKTIRLSATNSAGFAGNGGADFVAESLLDAARKILGEVGVPAGTGTASTKSR